MAPPFAPLAEHLATDSRFTFDGVDITDSRAMAIAESEHIIGASARLLEPDLYKDGVRCQLLILGVNRDGVVVNCGYTTAVVKPDGEGRVSIEDKLEIPRGKGEYEFQIEIFEDNENNYTVGRVPLTVIPSPEPEPDQESGS